MGGKISYDYNDHSVYRRGYLEIHGIGRLGGGGLLYGYLPNEGGFRLRRGDLSASRYKALRWQLTLLQNTVCSTAGWIF